MFKIAICDDEVTFQKVLRKQIESYYGMLEVEIIEFSSGIDLVNSLKKCPLEFQMIFMDIEMPNMDGIETSKRIRRINESIPIIFLTSHTEFAMEGYEVDAFRFLDKPLKIEKLVKTLQDYDRLRLLESRIELQDGEKIVLVKWTEIQYIQSENVYINVYLEDTRYLIRKKLSDVQEQMPKQMFFRPHRSYLINLRFVKFFDGKKIIMKNGNEIPLSRGKRSEFKAYMMSYMHSLG
ncbi:LytR/AlgR family response regulator transcription factor [Anaerotignum sp.]|uniref:LytR/AlgR family response regulator transcription factor n=1 Tax=Anaerotignum sp. TaxID=2039241 RepID=UPI0027147F10|nr:LytTR family DNA-binding domain-containing protein [Anaerotignum sp.]